MAQVAFMLYLHVFYALDQRMYFTFSKQPLTNGCITRNAFSLSFLYLRKTFLLLEPNVQSRIEMLC